MPMTMLEGHPVNIVLCDSSMDLLGASDSVPTVSGGKLTLIVFQTWTVNSSETNPFTI